MKIEVTQEPIGALAAYALIPIAFEVKEVFDVAAEPGDDGGFSLSAHPLRESYWKDYDRVGGEGPTRWAKRFDVSKWGFFAARIDGKRVGGAAVAHDTPSLDLLEGRSDLAVLWDLRVAPSARCRGVGSALFEAAEAWACARRCRHLKVETQNVNVVACRFYASQGCVLRAAHRGAYPELPDEIQLLWYKDLAHRESAEGGT
jgi:GNAT superfamily N-acetyltransferase